MQCHVLSRVFYRQRLLPTVLLHKLRNKVCIVHIHHCDYYYILLFCVLDQNNTEGDDEIDSGEPEGQWTQINGVLLRCCKHICIHKPLAIISYQVPCNKTGSKV